MKIIPRWIVKALSAMTHPRVPLDWTGYQPRTRFDYSAEVGDGMGSSVIMAPIMWIARTFPEAPLELLKAKGDGEYDAVEDHPMLDLIEKPNPFYSGLSLLMASLVSWNLSGNVYWLKRRNKGNRAVQELWYLPHWTITPQHDHLGQEYITSYLYNPGTGVGEQVLPVDDIVHFKFGIDPRNVRLGLSPLSSVLREVFTDDEASNFTASILRNMGIPGIVISPTGEGVLLAPNDREAIRKKMTTHWGGDNRGKPIVLQGAAKVEQFGFNAKDLELTNIRNLSEERVCALIGIPPAVVGFGTGLETTKVGATMHEMVKLAWKGNIIPTQKFFAADLKLQLLNEFEPEPENFLVQFDRSEIEALQESRQEEFERINEAVKAGWKKVIDAQREMGWEEDETQDVYLRPMATVEVASGQPRESGLAAFPKGKKTIGVDDDDPTVDLLENNPPRRREPDRMQLQLVRRLEKNREAAALAFAQKLDRFFQDLGRHMAAAAQEIIKARTLERKDITETDGIMAFFPDDGEKKFRALGESAYFEIAKTTFDDVGAAIGLEIGFNDPAQKLILEEGGKNMGLIDLKKQTRACLFRELSEAREVGESVPQIIRRIRDKIPAGPWSDSRTRAEVIARTEALNAQRISTVEAYKASGVVRRVLVMDNRTGFNDEDCMWWDGREIRIEEASAVMAAEHPNGTRSVVPIID